LEQPLGESDVGRGGEEVRDVPDGAELLGHGLHEGRMRMPEGVDRDAAEEVEVTRAVGVPHVRALTAHEDPLRCAEGVHHRAPVALGPVLAGVGHDSSSAASGTTRVPTPASVKISRSMECSRRPSMTCACGTPPRTARRHASILGTMPEDSVGSMTSRSPARICETRLEGSGQAAYSPSTSVSMTSLVAPSATASAAAAVSALTLS